MARGDTREQLSTVRCVSMRSARCRRGYSPAGGDHVAPTQHRSDARQQGVPSARQHPRQSGRPQGRPEVPDHRRHVPRRPQRRRRARRRGPRRLRPLVPSPTARSRRSTAPTPRRCPACSASSRRPISACSRCRRRSTRPSPRPLLASERVRYVGEPIAAVVAETRQQAVDAAEAVVVDYDLLEVYVDPEAALAASTDLLYDAAGSNVVFDSTALGMPDLTGDDFFAGCEATASGRFINQRVAPCPLEVRGVGRGVGRRTAAPVGVDAARPGHQGGHRRRQRRRCRRRPRASRPTSAAASAPRSARTPRRWSSGRSPSASVARVRWQETRSESMMALGHGRAQVQNVTIGGCRDGTVTHYRLHVVAGLRSLLRHGRDPRPVHDPTDVVGRVRDPEHRVPHDVGGHQHDADRRLPRAPAVRRRRRRSSGRWTSSPPRSASTPPTCGART